VSWRAALQRLRRRDPAEDELDAELRDHVERQVADYVRAGLSPREARRRARLEFGGLDQIKALCRDVRGNRWIEDLGRDLRYALRRAFKDRRSGVPLFAVAALAIGIGASTAMFSVLDAVVLQPLPFTQEERLVAGWKTSRTDPTRFVELSYPEFLQWQAQSTSFESLAALPTTVYGYSYVLTGRGDPVSIESARVTGEFFDVLGMPPLLGRTFAATDDREGAQPTVVLTHAFWTNVLGADPAIIGSGLTLTGVDFTVIGVLPAGFVFPRGVDVFTALGTRPGLANNRTVFLQVIGRLHPNVSRAQASLELDGIVSRLEAQRPGSTTGDQTAALTPLRDHILGSGRVVAALLFAGTVVLLLVAGVNLSGLLATRAARRGGEVALRLGLGASTRDLLRQFVAEGLVIATMGTIAGIGLAVAILEGVIALAPDGMARIGSASIDGWSFLFAAACLVAVTLLIGCVPLSMVRNRSIDALLRGGAAGVGGSTHARIGGALLAVETAGTVVLLIVAGALTVSFLNLRDADLGFDREGVLTAFVNPSRVRYPDAAARRGFFRDVIARLEANAEVEAAGAALLRPLEGVIGWDLPYRLPGQSPEDAASNSILNLEVVTPTWFEAIGTPLLAGRGFHETDGRYRARAETDPAALPATESAGLDQPAAAGASTVERRASAAAEPTAERRPLVAIVSESVAREMYGSPLDAVGRRFIGGRNAPRSYRIIGVVADGRYRRLQETSGDVFLPYTQSAIPLRYLVIRTSAGPAAARGMVRRALAEVDPEQPMSADLTTTELVERALSRERFQSALLLPFGLGSALLAAIGVFGMASDTANRRQRELALRRALGASRGRVVAELLRSTLACVSTGLCVGMLLAIATGRALNLALFETRLADPWILVAVCALILGVSLAACSRPAARVSRLDVGAVLRQ
jgi:putative ABC transport system permease protein